MLKKWIVENDRPHIAYISCTEQGVMYACDEILARVPLPKHSSVTAILNKSCHHIA